MKRLLLCVASLSVLAFSMDRPPQASPAAAVKGPSKYVQAGRGLFSAGNFRTMLANGTVVTFEDLDALADLDDANKSSNTLFWLTHGIEFLMKANLVSFEPLTLKNAAAKQVNKTLIASKQDYPRAIQKLPADLKDIVASGNPQFVLERLKDLLGVPTAKNVKPDLEIERQKNKLALDLWHAVLSYETIPHALGIIIPLYRSKINPAKAAIFNSMIDDLVNKICKNILLITGYLRKQNKLRPLFAHIRMATNTNIANWGQMIDASDLQKDQRILLGLLGSNATTCPTFVKERLLDIIK